LLFGPVYTIVTSAVSGTGINGIASSEIRENC
jgi:hypothetical protein